MNGPNSNAFLDAIPAARSKLLIDMVNCLDVVDGHICVAQAHENSFLSRLSDAVSGKGQRRNNAIAEHHQTSLRNVIDISTDLARQVAHGHRVLTIVGQRLETLELSLARVADVIVLQRDELHALCADIKHELTRVNAELKRLDMHAAARDQIEWVFSRWDAGMWNTLPLAGRCYIAMNELYWGNFGEYYRSHPGQRSNTLLEDAQQKASALMYRSANCRSHDDRVALSAWLAPAIGVSNAHSLFAEGLSWLGDSHRLTNANPIAYLCTQWSMLEKNIVIPNTIPRLMTAARMVGMVSDIFFEDLEEQHAH